ncbi:hypothetical protein AB6A40_008324 [Gnathostoma spinigerum]|uniref:DUF19 domain-containing protein n=1 Tax=Gnathostoma spinigerum TaxID=75299 RepID=A0ABD6EZ97_9BILA
MKATNESQSRQHKQQSLLNNVSLPQISEFVDIDEQQIEPNNRSDEQLISQCGPLIKNKARGCFESLIAVWRNVNSRRPNLNNISFPLYRYTKKELLELCDEYANVYLCAGFDPIMRCLTDDWMRLARDYLGYVCSPSNIQKFMTQYECVVRTDVRRREMCEKHLEDESKLVDDIAKCKALILYFNCMKSEVARKCGVKAVVELKTTITEFGCSTNKLIDLPIGRRPTDYIFLQ